MAEATLELQARTIRQMARPITGARDDYDPVLELIGSAQLALIGEASHGTHEFYQERAEITKRLIKEQGFNAIAVEADFPDAYEINRYVRGSGDGATAIESLAASDWDRPAERKRVRPALRGSYESLFHDLNIPQFFVNLREGSLADHELDRPRLERAIGVIYRPETERLSHYFFARIAEQFDGVIHLDETRALEPLERTAQWEKGEPPETFPSGI